MTEIDSRALIQLARAVTDTAREEIDCDTFLDRAAAYLEGRAQGKADLSPTMAAVEQHLAVCPECFEEFRVLKRAIEV